MLGGGLAGGCARGDMETTTIKQIKKGYRSKGCPRIYVVEGEGCVLYVGRSKCAIARMMSHVGSGPWVGFWGSVFDYMIKENPKSNEYAVTFYDESEINAAITYPYESEESDYPHTFALDQKVKDIEEHLIYELSPVFNAQGQKKHSENIDKWYNLYPVPVVKVE